MIGKAIVNLLTGIVTSPFRMLAGLVGAEESSFEAVAFTAGREDLSPPEEEKLALLADALTQRPQLQLTIVPAVAADVDEPALKLQKFESLLEARVAETDDGRRTELERTERAIRALYEEAGLVPALAEQREVHRVEVEGKSQIDETALTETLRAALVEAQDVPSSELVAHWAARGRTRCSRRWPARKACLPSGSPSMVRQSQKTRSTRTATLLWRCPSAQGSNDRVERLSLRRKLDPRGCFERAALVRIVAGHKNRRIDAFDRRIAGAEVHSIPRNMRSPTTSRTGRSNSNE